MAARRASARLSSGNAPKTSPQSTRSDQPDKGTPTRKSGARASGGGKKESPYFSKKGEKGKTRKQRESYAEEDGAELDSATGMTETSSSSSSEQGHSEDDFDPSSEDEGDAEEDIESVDSDFLDEGDTVTIKNKAKRKSTGGGGGGGGSAKKAKVKTVSGSRGANGGIEGYDDEDENIGFDEDNLDLAEDEEIALRIYPAPKTGQVPPGRISQNTLNFLKNMFIPERNDRDWFRSHEPAFRQAENEWKAFAGLIQVKIHEADDEIPILPPKDVLYRIYRDIRFSSDKTPYKKSFSMSTSRTGRKGTFAGYFLAISPHGRSVLASGIWMPDKNVLQAMRNRFLTNSQEFRNVISRPEFVKIFGPAKPHPDGERQNVFGHDDALKVAPSGIDKHHPDIDLLRLRTIAVVHNFTDEEVLAKDFQEKIKEIVQVLVPFVHLLNDYMTNSEGV